ncbi:hypothetical protein [Nocardioides sp. cx-173]|uniref:hypothetical protein n=1 Tax=Nocardioides sp. cx-173 TaxID=2898796 RepID=UPI001E613FB9|nr:hypothetical protein [Nocardioides sp. cx-173]MCD4525391.1 hypothetical protein [Nocardioides sp. cx-173]UGB40813.1 hypothetical protein LQ940_15705 [Nocardioides sp. cx-173]
MTTREERSRSVALMSVALLTVAALVLVLLVWRAAASGGGARADVGEILPLRAEPPGQPVTVQLPGSEVTVTVGAPVATLDHELLEVEYDDPRWEDDQDLVAPDGGTLVPLSWRARALGGLMREGDPTPIRIRLLAGDEGVDLTEIVLDGTSASMDADDQRPVVVAFAGRHEVEDLTIEVEYDGLTQTGHVDSGDIDAGVAQPLYDDEDDFTAGCAEVEDRCELSVVDPRSPRRPDSATLTASYLTLYPYDRALGWAEEGTLWAGVRLHVFGTSGVVDARGGYWSVLRFPAPKVTLDGAEPVRREDLGDAERDTYGRVVFQVDADQDPRELTIEATFPLSGPGSPPDLPLRAVLDLAPVG